MSEITPTGRTLLKRRAERGTHDRACVDAILDEAFVCHVACTLDGSAISVPMVHARVGEQLVLHGSNGNRLLRALCAGSEACVTVMLLDGLILARSAFHSSVNYRSVVVYGSASEVTDLAEKERLLEAIVEHSIPGRFPDVRPPNPQELRQTLVVTIPLVEASAKVRSQGPVEEAEDYALDCWAGIIPLELRASEPIPDEKLADGIAAPDYVARYRRPARQIA